MAIDDVRKGRPMTLPDMPAYNRYWRFNPTPVGSWIIGVPEAGKEPDARPMRIQLPSHCVDIRDIIVALIMMALNGLTTGEYQTWITIYRYIYVNDVVPTQETLGSLLGVTGPAVHKYMAGLIRKGFITKEERGHRSTRLLVSPITE